MPTGARPWVWPVLGTVGAIVGSPVLSNMWDPERGYAGLALALAAALFLWVCIKPARSGSTQR